MIKRVIKKSGKKEIFSKIKVKKSIKRAVENARVPEHLKQLIIEETVSELLERLERFDETTTAQIRDIILLKLQQMDPAVVTAWIAYELQKITEEAAREKRARL
ncbi:MAG: ATP cone domain-containing protein [Nanoarchaeota archaeon]